MKYPKWNSEWVDTGLRSSAVVYSTKKGIQSAYILIGEKITRRCDAITDERDVIDSSSAETIFDGSVSDAIQVLAQWTPPGEELFRDASHVYYVDEETEKLYINKIKSLCQDGDHLAKHLNDNYKNAEHLRRKGGAEKVK